jgi:hypothetical protein
MEMSFLVVQRSLLGKHWEVWLPADRRGLDWKAVDSQ